MGERDFLKEYLYSRHQVQLLETSLVEPNLEKIEDTLIGKYENLLDLKQKIEVENGNYYGYLKVEVKSQNIETKQIGYKIALVYKGLFSGNIDDQNIKKLIQNQLVAQLYPFARGAIATMSAFMNIPRMVIVPTIDVVATLEKNDNVESEA